MSRYRTVTDVLRDDKEIVEAFAALDADLDRLCALSFEVFTTPERLRALERLEQVSRRLRVPQHALINELKAQALEEELGAKLCPALAHRLRITKAEAGRRIAEAEDLGPRRALSGQPLEPVLTHTAQGQRDGLIGDGHIKIIRSFFAHLPAEVDVLTREAAEADLAGKATWMGPDQLAKYAHGVLNVLDPDGDLKDEERARSRRLIVGDQQPDGMSELRGLITPELRAAIEAMLAKLAAPGMCNPADDTPVIDGEPDDDVVKRDARSQAQRNHDGLLAGIRGLLASEKLGSHRGLPTEMIMTISLKDLEARAGRALTAGGTLVPISDVIKMLGQADPYLAIFDKAKPLALYHAKRCANLAQRLMLLAKERGCTRPGCDVPGYWTQVHHTEGWAKTRRTDITTLTLACQPDNLLVEKGWKTRNNARGDTEWIPPPHLDTGQPRTNTFHHPEKLFNDGDDEAP